MFKNNAESVQHTADQERQDSMVLKKRALDDARNDADSFASNTQPQDGKTAGPLPLNWSNNCSAQNVNGQVQVRRMELTGF